MAEVEDRPVEPLAGRRRIPVWVAIGLAVVLLAVVVLGGWALATLLDDGDDADEQWEACAERVDPPAARSERMRELGDAEDLEAARDRLAQETRRAEQRIEAECGERP